MPTNNIDALHQPESQSLRPVLQPAIQWQLDGDTLPDHLFSLLRSVNSEGTLSAAAKRCGISYRNAWNLVNAWSERFGAPLIQSRRGSGAALTALGEKLLWANDYAREQSRDMFRSIGQRVSADLGGLLTARSSGALRISASHCLSHDILRRLIEGSYRAGVVVHHGGSARCLAHLGAGEIDAAGFHLADGSLGGAFVERYAKQFDPDACQLILATKRRQGLIVGTGNPCGINGIEDLLRGDIRFVNRQANSGTRILLDLLLEQAGIDGSDMRGFDNIEFTHSAVSALVAGQKADVAVGTEAAAVAFDLDFIPLATESYFYAVRRSDWEHPGIVALREVLAGRTWKQEVSKFDGYDISDSGRTKAARELFARD